MGEWLTKDLELPQAIADKFKENAVTGADLIELSDEDLTQELGCKPLQARLPGFGSAGAAS